MNAEQLSRMALGAVPAGLKTRGTITNLAAQTIHGELSLGPASGTNADPFQEGTAIAQKARVVTFLPDAGAAFTPATGMMLTVADVKWGILAAVPNDPAGGTLGGFVLTVERP